MDARTVTRTIAQPNDFYALLTAGHKGDTLQTSKATLVLVTRVGGPNNNELVLADATTGSRWMMHASKVADILAGRTIAWTFNAQAEILPDPAIAAAKHRHELELELAGLVLAYNEMKGEKRTRRGRDLKRQIAELEASLA